MDFTKFLSELSLINKKRTKEEELIRIEENALSEIMLSFSQKTTNFIPIGFETQEDEENEEIVNYSEYSGDEEVEEMPQS